MLASAAEMPHSGTNNVSVSRYCRMNPCGRTISRSGPAAKKEQTRIWLLTRRESVPSVHSPAEAAANPPGERGGRRKKCKQRKPHFSFQCRVGKQLHKQRPVSQPIEHRKQKDQNRPQCGKAHQEQKGRGRSKRKIFRSEKAGRSMCICSSKQAAPALQVILQPVRLLLFAESQKHAS